MSSNWSLVTIVLQVLGSALAGASFGHKPCNVITAASPGSSGAAGLALGFGVGAGAAAGTLMPGVARGWRGLFVEGRFPLCAWTNPTLANPKRASTTTERIRRIAITFSWSKKYSRG